MSNSNPIIEFKDVVKIFGEKVILDGISLSIPKGETLCVIGGSGTGKSVTLKLLLGLIPIDGGEIFFEGKPISSLNEDELSPLRKRMGMVFQGSALFDSMTVYENIAYPLIENGQLSYEEIDEIVFKKLDLVGLKESADLFPSSLSGGMMKRIGLARAIATDPDVILYDEPTAGLDPSNVNRIDDLILRLKKISQVTSVVVTHHMDSVMKIADRVALLYKKKIYFCGTLDEFKNSRDSVVRNFISGNIGD